MAHMLQTRVQQLLNVISSLFLFWVLSTGGNAQTTLLPGDLLVVSLNGSNSSIEVVPLIDLEENTSFILKVGSNTSSELVVNLNSMVEAGNSLVLSKEVSSLLTLQGDFDLNPDSDQITFLQNDEGVNRILLTASWGNQTKGMSKEPMGDVPQIILADGKNHQYHLKNGASGTPKMIRRMISNPAHWKSSKQPYEQLRTSFRILEAPVIVFNQNVSTVMEGDSIPLNVAIYEHDGSRLTVDVALNESFSTADTNDIPSFQTYTYNFTGLIGDAVYEIAVPQVDDEIFEDQETAFFELNNLTAGNFGDFVSHATFIIDNEIPDVSIASVFNSNELNEDYLVLQNNERVYVNINDWILQSKYASYELKKMIDLAPLEQRTISASDVIDTSLENGQEFELSGEIISAIDGFGNTISQFQLRADTPKEPELVENKTKELNLDLDVPITTVQQELVIIEQNVEAEQIPSIPKSGWAPVQLVENKASDKVIFWDEQLSRFREFSEVSLDSVSGLSFFEFIEAEIEQPEFEIVNLDSSSSFDFIDTKALPEADWGFTLSGTDSDDNGIINGAEGYNFVQFQGVDSILVSSFIKQIEQQIGEDFIYPMIFKVDDSSAIHSLERQDYLYENDFFWIKTDSLLEKVELNFPVRITDIAAEQPLLLDEPISNFKLSVRSDKGESFLNVNFFDIEASMPLDKLNPAFDLRAEFILGNSPTLAAYSASYWNSEINSTYEQETLLSYPIGIMNSESAEISIVLEDWNMEGGWRLFIEEVESKEKTELFPGEEFKIEYVVEKLQEQQYSDTEFAINALPIKTRYHLLIASPAYEETMQEAPEQIALNQNFPNPFNPATTISFFIPEALEVKLSVFNVVGQPVAVLEDGVMGPGEHHYEWNATGFPSGMYIYQLEVGNKVMTRKMTLVK